MAKSVFISSTSSDLQDYREKVRDVILRLDMRPIDMKYFGAQGDDASGVSLKEVAKADVFVGIIARRYGFVPEGADISVTEQEYNEAVRLHIPCLMYLLDPTYNWPEDRIEPGDKAQTQLKAFRAKIEKTFVRSLFTTPDNLAAQITADLTKLSRRQLLNKRLWTAVTGLVVIVLVVLGLAAFTNVFQLLGIQAPTPMEAGKFNVVVAGSGVQQSNGIITREQVADSVNDIVLGSLTDLTIVDNIRGRNDPGVGYILGPTAQDRAIEAAKIAERLNADIVIYGKVTVQQAEVGSYEFAPEFYVAPRWASLQPEVIGAEALGEPVQILQGSGADEDLKSRISTLQSFLSGWKAFLKGQYATAQSKFEEALTFGSSAGLQVLDIMAGNAASRQQDYQGALDLYTASLQGQADYARGLLGRGAALFQIAGQINREQHPSYDPTVLLPANMPCNSNEPAPTQIELVMQLSEVCLKEAQGSLNQTPNADIDVKVALQFGALYLWRTQSGFGDHWADAKINFETAITLYNQSSPQRQSRIRTQAALAYGYLADGLMLKEKDSPESVKQAAADYQHAIDLFRQDPNQAYANPLIQYYQTQAAPLQP